MTNTDIRYWVSDKSIEKFENLQQENAVIDDRPSQKEDYIFIRKDRKQVKLSFADMLYIQSLKDYISIHTERETHTIKHSISSFHELLDRRFIRTHRSYVVNSDKITAYTAHDIELNTVEIPIGENYRKQIADRLKR